MYFPNSLEVRTESLLDSSLPPVQQTLSCDGAQLSARIAPLQSVELLL